MPAVGTDALYSDSAGVATVFPMSHRQPVVSITTLLQGETIAVFIIIWFGVTPGIVVTAIQNAGSVGEMCGSQVAAHPALAANLHSAV